MLQTTGPISLSDIAIEFGGTKPHSLSEYYGKGTDTPLSGPISFSDFYGKSAYTLIIPDKSFGVFTTQTTTIQTASIIDGVYDSIDPSNTFTVVSVSSPISGDVVLDGSYINFTSTNIVGEPASFIVTIQDKYGKQTDIDVTMNVLAQPEPSASSDCLINKILGINEITGEEEDIICEILYP